MVSTTERRVRELAREALTYFESEERQGEGIIVLKDSAPEWVRELVFVAHDGMLPDDWRYSRVMFALDYVANATPDADLDDLAPEFATDMVDPYTKDRVQWLGSHLRRPEYVNEAVSGGGYPGDVIEAIGLGQFQEALEIYRMVIDYLRRR